MWSETRIRQGIKLFRAINQMKEPLEWCYNWLECASSRYDRNMEVSEFVINDLKYIKNNYSEDVITFMKEMFKPFLRSFNMRDVPDEEEHLHFLAYLCNYN